MTATVTISEHCGICENFVGCRGQCPGTDDGRPCSGFALAENRDGDCCRETGDWDKLTTCNHHLARITTVAAVTTAAMLLPFFSLACPARAVPVPGCHHETTEADPGRGDSGATRVAADGPARSDSRVRSSEFEVRSEKTGQVLLLPGQTWRRSGVPPRAPDLADSTPSANANLLLTRANLAGLLAAMLHVESGGNDRAVGDGGKSRGPYQIKLAYWRDATERGGVQWDYLRLVWSRPHCEQAILWYWDRYCPEALAAGDLETLARIRNGGPDWATKPATLGYWRRVKKELTAEDAENAEDKAERRQK